MNKFIKVFLMIFLSLCILSSCDKPVENKDGIIINEICSNNQSSYSTLKHNYYDWVELYNTTEEDVYLRKYGLSDDEKNLFRFILPDVTIKAKSYLIVFFNTENSDKEDLVAGFGLSSSGESLYLTMPNGNICDMISFPALETDVTYGRYNNGFDVLNPTPNVANESKPRYKYVNSPVFSQETGFYSSEFNLTLTSDSGTKIYYTLDSSIPSINSLEYTGSILIKDPSTTPNVLKSREDITAYENKYSYPTDKALIVRAIAVSSDGNVSDVVTHSYFINKRKYKNENIISIVTDSYNLLDYEHGIYVKGKTHENWIEEGSKGHAEYNWSNKGREWERECNIEYLIDGSSVFNQDCGIRIHGYGGRGNAIKSFNLYARSCYGESYFKDPIFDGATKTKSFILKYDRYSTTVEKFRDGFVQSLVKNTNVTVQEYEKCIVFLNGEYWETYLAMQKYTDDFIEDEYGINKEDAVIIKDGELEEGTEEDLKEYKELISFVKKTDFKKESNYNKFCTLVDIDSLIDYYITQIYVNNFDFSTKKDFLLWKSKRSNGSEYSDGLWRFMIYDMDTTATKVSFRTDDGIFTYDYKFDIFTGEFLYAGDLKDDIFFTSLIKNKTFKEKFTQRFMDLCNTVFEKENIKNILKQDYNLSYGTMVDFFENRFDYISKYYANYIGISNELIMVKVDSESEYKLNTLNLKSSYNGYYYDSMFITLETTNEYTIEDLEIVSQKGNIVILNITGNNPTIKIR